MTSFYGGGAGKVIVSAGAVGDYNSIENAPIKNLEGTAESPIILNQVADGVYVLKGNYKLSDFDEDLKNELFNKSVTVETDVTTGTKVVTYSYVSDGEAWLRIIIFNDDGTYSEKDESLSSNPTISIDEGDE